MDVEKANTLTLSILEEASAYNQWIFDKVKPWLGKGILEVGCGIGNLTGLLLQAGKVVASDMNPQYLQRVGREVWKSFESERGSPVGYSTGPVKRPPCVHRYHPLLQCLGACGR